MKPIAVATPDQVRETLRPLAAERGIKLSELSRLLCRDGGYLTGFVWGRGPERLRSVEGQMLARFFRVHPSRFGERQGLDHS
jgi:hypothetical protein